jgi:hypothetical protein
MNEPDVTLTNLVIVVECLAFGWACARGPRSVLRNALVAFFAASALASGSAGLVHGYAPNHGDASYSLLWTVAMLAIIAASAALALAAGEVIDWSRTARRRLAGVIAITAACLSAAVILGWREFTLAVVVYVSAIIWLAYAFAARWWDRRSVSLVVGIAGLLLAILAGVLQQLQYSPVPGLLSHNAWYHVLQIIALAAFFSGCKDVLAKPVGVSPNARPS